MFVLGFASGWFALSLTLAGFASWLTWTGRAITWHAPRTTQAKGER